MLRVTAEADVHAVLIPRIEGAVIALKDAFDGHRDVEATKACAVVLRVVEGDDERREYFLPALSPEEAHAFGLLVHDGTTLGTAQVLGELTPEGPYRAALVPSDDYHGFPCGDAATRARDRAAQLRYELRERDVTIELYAIPLLRVRIAHTFSNDLEGIVVRLADGRYAFERARLPIHLQPQSNDD